MWTFVGKVMSLFFNMLSGLIIDFLPRSKRLFNFMAAVSSHTYFGTQENKVCHCFYCFHFPHLFAVKWWDQMPWSSFFECWVLSQLFHFFFTLIKRLFISFLLSAIRVVSSAYLRLWIFFPAILIPACASSSLAFHMMYSAYNLNKQGDNIQPWCTPFWIRHQSIVQRLVLTVASPSHRLLRRQVRCSGTPISFRMFQFVVIHTKVLA